MSFNPLISTLRRSKTCLSFLMNAPTSLPTAMVSSNTLFRSILIFSSYGQYDFPLYRIFLIMGNKFLQGSFNILFVQLGQLPRYTGHSVLTKRFTELH